MKGNAKIIKTLNELLAGELTAIDQLSVITVMTPPLGINMAPVFDS